MSTKKEKNFRSSTLLAMLVLGSIALSHPDAWAGGNCKTTAPGWVGCTSPAQATATCICKQNSSAIANYQGNQGPDGFPDIYMCQGTYTGPIPPPSCNNQTSRTSSSSSTSGGTSQNLLGGPGSGTSSTATVSGSTVAGGDADDTSAQNNTAPVDPDLNTPAKITPEMKQSLQNNDTPPPLVTLTQMGGNTNPLNGLPPAKSIDPNEINVVSATFTAPIAPPLETQNAQITTMIQPSPLSGAVPFATNGGLNPSQPTGGSGLISGSGASAGSLSGPPPIDSSLAGSPAYQEANQSQDDVASRLAAIKAPTSGQPLETQNAELTATIQPQDVPSYNGPGGSGQGQTASTDPSTTTPAKDGKDQAPEQKFTPSDKCTNSQKFGIPDNCSSTKTMMSTTQIMVAGGQMAGSATLNTMGQTAQQNLMVNGASQSSIYQSSVDMQKNAAKAQITLGAAQLAMGYLIHNKANTAKTNTTNLEGVTFQNKDNTVTATTVNGGISAPQVMKTYNLNIGTKNGGTMGTNLSTAATGKEAIANAETAKTAAASANNLATAAYTEQNNLHEAASTSSLTNMITGGQALLSGAFAWRNANAEQNLLNKLNNLPVATAPSADPFNTLSSTGSGTTITGDGTSGASGASAAASPLPVPSAPLGNALGNAPDNTIAAAPVAPEAGAPTGSTDIPSSGGMGGGAIGTSAAPAGSDADPQAKYADNGKGVAAYESAGFAPGGGGAKGGSGNGDAINPKDLLAAMMDQMNGKKDEPQGQDILAYGRSPASDAPFAPLPKEENFFNYIHNAYQGLQRKSRVGLN